VGRTRAARERGLEQGRWRGAELGKWRAALARGAGAGRRGVRAQEVLAQAAAASGRAEAGGVCRCWAAGAEAWARGIGARSRCWSGQSRRRMEHVGSAVLSRRVCRRRTWRPELAA
jgi:hypothetical protein